MSQFELENVIREATRMDSSLNVSKTGLTKPRRVLDNTNTDLNLSTAGIPMVIEKPANWTGRVWFWSTVLILALLQEAARSPLVV